MKRIFNYWALFALVLILSLQSCGFKKSFNSKFDKGLVEYSENPINIDVENPRFSWVVSSEDRGQRQNA